MADKPEIDDTWEDIFLEEAFEATMKVDAEEEFIATAAKKLAEEVDIEIMKKILEESSMKPVPPLTTTKDKGYYGGHYVVFDAETNGLLYEATKCNCLVFYCSKKDRILAYWDDVSIKGPPGVKRTGTVKHGVRRLAYRISNGATIVGHNITGYDFPMFQKLDLINLEDEPYFSVFNKDIRIEDTYINCCLLNPEQPPGLDYWGKRLGILKPVIEDWKVFTTETIHRCVEDVKINKALYLKQLKRLKKHDWSEAQKLEQQVNYIHSQQVLHGIRIDILRARALLVHLDDRLEALEASILPRLPPTVIKGDEYLKPFLKSGAPQAYVRAYFKEFGITPFTTITYPMEDGEVKNCKTAVRIGGKFSKVSFEPVNLNSHPRVKEILTGLGWIPTEWNYKKDKKGAFIRDERGQLIPTSPKLTEDSYASLPPGLGSDIAEFLMLSHRRRFILNESDSSKGLLSFVRPENGYAPADAFTCGTNTGRYRHKGALVNLPRPKTTFGKELRSLFTVPSDCYMLGIDLSGIEARVMAHYAFYYDEGKYLTSVLDPASGKEKDIHQENADILGVTRDTAKSFLYAISYGAGAKKLASVLGTTIPKAKALIKKYWDTHYGLRDLVSELEAEYMASGTSILGLDGRKLYIRGNHKLLNTLVQSAAAIIFKRWMVKCYQITMHTYGINRQILAYHDELGWQIPRSGDVEYFADRMLRAIVDTGVELKLNVPLSGDYKIGKSYDEVH